MKITIYKPLKQAKRIKIKIPYEMKVEREMLKKIEGRWYHKEQKLWSIPFTPDNMNMLKLLFKGKYELLNQSTPPQVPSVTLKANSMEALAKVHQKLVLKGYSEHVHIIRSKWNTP